jgi:hypothetical protein
MPFLKGKRRGGLEIKMVQKGAKRRERKIAVDSWWRRVRRRVRNV